MQKVVEFLEKYVQWVAIGLGALFVLFMVYTYVLNPPATVELGGTTRTPGEVDPYTLENVGKQLESAMSDRGKINLTVPTYVQAFRDSMGWQNAPKVALAALGSGSQTLDVPLPPAPVAPGAPGAPGGLAVVNNANGGGGGAVAPGDQAKVKVLPTPPKATPAEHRFGRSVVLPPPAPGQVAAAVQPVAVIPGQPAPPPAGVDEDWVTHLFHINLEQLNAAFQNSRIPPDFYLTTFLQVEMERQELMPDGSWGNGQVVPPVGVWRAQQPPPPLPGEGSPRDQFEMYLQWASANTPDILQPLFLTVERGDPWLKPGPLPVAADVIFDPNQHLTGDIPATLSPEQRQQVLDARRAATKAKQDAAKQARPTRQPTGPRGPGGPGGIPGDMVEPSYAAAPGGGGAAVTAAGRPPGYRPAGAPPYRPGMPPPGIYDGPVDTLEGGYPGGGMGAVAVPANLPQPGTDYPTGDFNPGDPKWIVKTPAGPPALPLIDVWAHDNTVEGGKTYRYRVRYKIKNPVWFAGNVTEPEALSATFALASEWSDWGSEVKVPPLVNFFVATSKAPTANSITFEVFKFEKGAQRSEKFPVSPGDTVGGLKNGVDFRTGWTVVDFRADPRTDDWQILLIDDDGKMVTRSFKGDRDDALYKGLQDQLRQQRAAEGVAVGSGALPPPGR